MTTNERSEIVSAVLASRDEVGPDLDDQLLEGIVDAEMNLPDVEAAERSILKAVSDAIDRGVGNDGGEA